MQRISFQFMVQDSRFVHIMVFASFLDLHPLLLLTLYYTFQGYEPEVGTAWKESWSMAGECNGRFEPTYSPTASPSMAPTTSPTAAPTISDFPSLSPSGSLAPSDIPSVSPSSQPPTCPVTNAVFDSNYGVPRCESASNSCDSGSLVAGRGRIDEGVEPNLSNT